MGSNRMTVFGYVSKNDSFHGKCPEPGAGDTKILHKRAKALIHTIIRL